MSRRDFKSTNPQVDEVNVENTVAEVAEAPKTVTGVVANCSKLNVRRKPTKDSEPVVVIEADDEVQIVNSGDNSNWYKIRTKDNRVGYCMKDYIQINA